VVKAGRSSLARRKSGVQSPHLHPTTDNQRQRWSSLVCGRSPGARIAGENASPAKPQAAHASLATGHWHPWVHRSPRTIFGWRVERGRGLIRYGGTEGCWPGRCSVVGVSVIVGSAGCVAEAGCVVGSGSQWARWRRRPSRSVPPPGTHLAVGWDEVVRHLLHLQPRERLPVDVCRAQVQGAGRGLAGHMLYDQDLAVAHGLR
jgi:hypothetical protein